MSPQSSAAPAPEASPRPPCVAGPYLPLPLLHSSIGSIFPLEQSTTKLRLCHTVAVREAGEQAAVLLPPSSPHLSSALTPPSSPSRSESPRPRAPPKFREITAVAINLACSSEIQVLCIYVGLLLLPFGCLVGKLHQVGVFFL
jgi:hypothetical protein